MALPLLVGSSRVGSLMLLGLPEEGIPPELLPLVSAVAALTMQHAFVHEQQEQAILERTAELSRTTEELQDLYHRAPFGYHSLDDNGLLVNINDTELEWLGYERSEVLGRLAAQDLLTAASYQVFQQRFPEFKQRGWLKDLELEMVRKDGTSFPVLLSARAVYDSHGGFVCSRTTVHDQTERKRAEEEKRRADSEWAAALDTSPVGICLLDLERRVRRANQAFCLMVGAHLGSIVGSHVTEWVHRRGEPLPCRVCEAQEARRDITVFLEVEHPSNVTGRPIEITSRVVRDAHDQTVGFIVTVHDLTLDRAMQRELRASEERYRTLFENSPVALWEEDFSELAAAQEALRREGVVDLSAYLDAHPTLLTEWLGMLRVLDVNQAALALHGAGCKTELVARLPHTFTPEGLVLFREGLLCLWSGRPSLTRDTVVKTLGGEVRHVTVSICFGPVASAVTCKALVSMVDVTEQKRAEQEREKFHTQLLHAQKMESLGSLAGGVAHDVNNVLGAILGLASVHANQAPSGSRLRQALDTIISACQRGGSLVKSLLGFARQELAEEKILDLNRLVREEVALLERTTLQKVRLETDLEEPLQPVKGDPSTLSHALMNLCVNAVDAMPEGGVLVLRSRNLPEGIVLEVQDSGEGMPPDVLERALDPFFTTKPQGKGTGLGLPIVYGTVKAHQGQLEIESRPGEGTLVRISLPTCAPPAPSGEIVAPAVVAGASLHVLLVDDDDLIQAAVSQLLEILGHRSTIASSGEEALCLLKEGLEVDLVILDVNMPGMGGRATLAGVRNLLPRVPVLLATGRPDPSLGQGMEHVAILPKPFTLAELGRSLEKVRST